ncbi:DUF4097 family beta strand repeat-containing protein [Woeseia oceani]|uniref:Adhesin domain-containing protein n=1 Tax=Woeseia oceani TaxID=1548547 RepID=A0A193LCR4_9GAMM|nr:hypothetical protein [Woeseia oceani]ANO50292.1 hypothetical protein BA177_02815 [Woeseia oceani]
MKSTLILALFVATFAHAAWNDYEEVRELRHSSQGVDVLDVKAAAGRLNIIGAPGARQVTVTATVVLPGVDHNKAAELIKRDLELSLVPDGNVLRLVARFEQKRWSLGASPHVHLDVQVPSSMALRLDDGSGPLEVRGTTAAITVEDGSGSISLRDTGGPVSIDDGSGSIELQNIAGDVHIVDGSGGIRVRGVQGSVSIEDGSGGIDVHKVSHNLTILNDGSGGIRYSDIQGAVDDRS